MLNAGVLTFQEFAMRETLPLATIHEAVLGFLQGRDDAVLSGAQAVNAYVSQPRMTQDIDLLSTDAEKFSPKVASVFERQISYRRQSSGNWRQRFQNLSSPQGRQSPFD